MTRKQQLDLAFSAPPLFSDRSGMRVTSHAKPTCVLPLIVQISQFADEIRSTARQREKERSRLGSIADQVRWAIAYYSRDDLAMRPTAVY